jgi:DNA replication protein DnaC
LTLLLKTAAARGHVQIWPTFAEHSDKKAGPPPDCSALAEQDRERDRRRIERHRRSQAVAGKTLETSTTRYRWYPSADRGVRGRRLVASGANLILIGPPGAAKSHLSSAIGLGLLEKGWRVLFARTSTSCSGCSRAPRTRARRRSAGSAASTCSPRWMTAYVTRPGRDLSAVRLISARPSGRALITANQPFGEWNKVFPDPAMTLAAVDRLVHHSTIFELNVESYRRRTAMQRKQHGPGRPATFATPKNVGVPTPRDKQTAA